MAHYTDWPDYPTEVLNLTDYPTQTDDVDDVSAWLVNALVHEMIAVQDELGTQPKGSFADVKTRLDNIYPQFHDRGDPSSSDLNTPTLVTDANWHDWDLSSIVPVGTKAVIIQVTVKDNVTISRIFLRKNGNTNTTTTAIVRSQCAGVESNGTIIIACDNDRKVEYNATNTTFNYITMTITGWWK